MVQIYPDECVVGGAFAQVEGEVMLYPVHLRVQRTPGTHEPCLLLLFAYTRFFPEFLWCPAYQSGGEAGKQAAVRAGVRASVVVSEGNRLGKDWACPKQCECPLSVNHD